MKILITLILIILSSCGNIEDRAKNSTAVDQISQIDSIAAELLQKAVRAGLKPNTQNDSLFLRLWISSRVKPDLVVEIRKSNGNWKGNEYSCMDDSLGVYNCTSFTKEFVDLDKFVDSLRLMSLSALVDQKNIKGFVDDIADGVTYTLQIHSLDSYRNLIYHCPTSFYSKDSNNQRFSEFIFMMNRHFGTRSLMCPKR